MNLISKIPNEIKDVLETLEKSGFEAYLVGGCVRDLIMNREPKDWDVTTNATPEQIVDLFPKTVYENKFGTVAVFTVPAEALAKEGERKPTDIVEITPYRLEAKYSDFRHPDEVKFSDKLEDDLKRRDFTINAIALDNKGHLVDLFEGLKDIKDKSLRTVGDPSERFKEDALRTIRAIRFAVELNFTVSHKTMEGIIENSGLIQNISAERIRDEFEKIIMSPNPMTGVVLFNKFGLLKHVIPELEEGIGCDQKGEHIYDVWEHSLRSLQHAADKEYPFHVKLAALFHDVGKPRTRRVAPVQVLPQARLGENFSKKQYTFYGHEIISARMTEKIMERMKFPKKTTSDVVKLVRYHMFFSDPEQITLSAVRRLVKNVGPDLVWDLMKIRFCDRVGMGRPKEEPYRLRKYQSMIEEAMRAPVSVGMLKIDGNKIMELTGEAPGPRLGWVLHALLEEALDNPDINTEEYLRNRVMELSKLSDQDLQKLGEAGKEAKEEVEGQELSQIRRKYGVK
jgi:putative nucleotidyltransferase with HDIG domain